MTGHAYARAVRAHTTVRKLISESLDLSPSFHFEVEQLLYSADHGHYLYDKCAHMYLLDTLKFEDTTTPHEFRAFTLQEGFTIRQSDKCWCGTWSDMSIEQNHMKVEGGLSRHGFSEVEGFDGVNFTTSEQHVDSRISRIDRDNEDRKKMLRVVPPAPTFSDTPEFISISRGIVQRDGGYGYYICGVLEEIKQEAVSGYKVDRHEVPTVSQENFLSNVKNKSRLITMLISKYNEARIVCKQATEDADTLIVAVEKSLADHMLFLNAINGCDSISALLNQGKQSIGNDLHSEQWEWKSTRNSLIPGNSLIPVTALQSPAPEKLLQLISCLFCTKLCLQCEGTCSNIDDRDSLPVTIPPSQAAEMT
ncbi:hypothetical protein PR048_010903 [Dryococelus australis]|uniref:Uncharacterized protein n=1 Tax=Dryococelus australis TaxID=614101 RepID=A0ABQ9I429_9NEOP|nr:hypothetical protein PR048_010903 [Dryococelus australis]